MKKYHFLCFLFLAACGQAQKTDPAPVALTANSAKSVGSVAFSWSAEDPVVVRNLSYTKNGLKISAPLTLPEKVPDFLRLTLPAVYGDFTAAEIKTKDTTAPLLIDHDAQGLLLKGLKNFYSATSYSEAEIKLSNANGVSFSLELRTPPDQVAMKFLDRGKDALTLDSPSLALTLLGRVELANPYNEPLNLSFAADLRGVFGQSITKYNLGTSGDNDCAFNTSQALDESSREAVALHLLEMSPALPQNFANELTPTMQKTSISLAPHETRIFGIYAESKLARSYQDNGVDYGATPKVNVFVSSGYTCRTIGPDHVQSCYCARPKGDLPLGIWKSQPSFTFSDASNLMGVSFQSTESDPAERTFSVTQGAIASF